MAEFEQARQAKGIQLIVLPTRSPNRMVAWEVLTAPMVKIFIRCMPMIGIFQPSTMCCGNGVGIYNYVRSHAFLANLTPHEFVRLTTPSFYPNSLICIEPKQSIFDFFVILNRGGIFWKELVF